MNNAHNKTTELKTEDLSSDKNSNCCDTQLKDCIGNCSLFWNNEIFVI